MPFLAGGEGGRKIENPSLSDSELVYAGFISGGAVNELIERKNDTKILI